MPAQHDVDALVQQRLAACVARVENLALRDGDGVERRRAVGSVEGQRAQRHARHHRACQRKAAQRAAARALPRQQSARGGRARPRRPLCGSSRSAFCGRRRHRRLLGRLACLLFENGGCTAGGGRGGTGRRAAAAGAILFNVDNVVGRRPRRVVFRGTRVLVAAAGYVGGRRDPAAEEARLAAGQLRLAAPERLKLRVDIYASTRKQDRESN